VRKALGAPGVFIGQFNGKTAGQSVPHVHFHIIPRFADAALKPHARERRQSSGRICRRGCPPL
jgi:histidine triad (HIT) family protein